jgi:hypothetical protein
MRDFILDDLQRRWDPSCVVFGMAAVLDPRNKSLSWLSAGDGDDIKRHLLEEVLRVVNLPIVDAGDDQDYAAPEVLGGLAAAVPMVVDAAAPAVVDAAAPAVDDDVDMFFYQGMCNAALPSCLLVLMLSCVCRQPSSAGTGSCSSPSRSGRGRGTPVPGGHRARASC